VTDEMARELQLLQSKSDADRAPRMLELANDMVAVARPGGDEPRIVTRAQFVDELSQQVLDRLDAEVAHAALRRLFGRVRHD